MIFWGLQQDLQVKKASMTYQALPSFLRIRVLLMHLTVLFSLVTGLLPIGGTVAAEPLIVYGDERLPPYEFVEDGQPKGINVDLWHAIGQKLGRSVDIRLTDWSRAQTEVLGGQGHALSSLGRTPEREGHYGFTQTTFRFSFSLFVRNGDAADFEDHPLETRRIGVTSAGLPRKYFEKNHPHVALVIVSDTIDGMRRVLRGDIDAFAANTWTGEYFLRELDINGLTPLPKPFTTLEGAVAVRKNDTELLHDIDRAISELKADGAFYRILDKWSAERVHIFSNGEVWALGSGAISLIVTMVLIALLISSRHRRRELVRKVAEATALLEIRNAELQDALCRQKQINSALQESESRFRLTANTAPVLIWVAGVDGLCNWFNDPWLAFTGRTLEQEMGDGWAEGVHPEDFGRCLETYRNAFALRKPFIMEYRLRRHDNVYRWVLDHGAPRFEANGEFYGYIGTCIDITPQKDAESVILRANADLERMVAERTAALTAANQELESYTFATSHDLRGPLGRINSFATLLERNCRDRLEGDNLLFLDLIRQNATRLTHLVDDLLTHARVSQKDLELRPLDLSAAARAVVHEKAQEAHNSRLEIRMALPPVQIMADSQAVEQVLGNLVENAIKYSSKVASPVVEVGGEAVGDRFRMWVRDNGIGFDMKYHDKIFQMFQRLHTYTEYPGSGVGLALVSRAMQRMEGKVWAESEPGKGTNFFLEFRLAAELSGGVDPLPHSEAVP